MSLQPQKQKDGSCYIIYDGELVSTPSMQLFDLEYLTQNGSIDQTVGGRGSSYFFTSKDQAQVLRHYRRGGLVGKILLDQYFGWSAEMSRSWREWRLLSTLYSEGFPVPRPVAACVCQSFLYYRADLITVQIPGTQTLAELLVGGELSADIWHSVGSCIKHFHERGAYHADLNAHNILLNQENRVFLLDFDRGKLRKKGAWQQSNLLRLQRSLLKLNGKNEIFGFSKSAWRSLLAGYGH